MKADSAWFREQSGLLVDALKQSENADLLDAFKGFNVKEAGGWEYFESPENMNDPWVQMFIRENHPLFCLTPEQSERWRAILKPLDFTYSSGAGYSTVLLTAQLLLGRTDVLGK